MAQQEPKVLSFDVVGTLIDFEGGILRYLRGAMQETAKHDDETLLAAYRTRRSSKSSGRFPDDLVRVYPRDGTRSRPAGKPVNRRGVSRFHP